MSSAATQRLLKSGELSSIAREQLGVTFPDGRITKDAFIATLDGREEPLATALKDWVKIK